MQSAGETYSAAYKDVSASVSQGMNAFFEAPDSPAALAALRSISLQPFEKIREIYTCVLKARLTPGKLAAALEVLSRADMIMGKIGATQEWRLLRYLDGMLAEDLQPILKGGNVRYVSEDLPFPVLLRIWNDSKKIRELSVKYAQARLDQRHERAHAGPSVCVRPVRLQGVQAGAGADPRPGRDV